MFLRTVRLKLQLKKFQSQLKQVIATKRQEIRKRRKRVRRSVNQTVTSRIPRGILLEKTPLTFDCCENSYLLIQLEIA